MTRYPGASARPLLTEKTKELVLYSQNMFGSNEGCKDGVRWDVFPREARSLPLLCRGCRNRCAFPHEEGRQGSGVLSKDQGEN